MASFIISSNRQPGVCLYTVFPIYYMYNKHCNLFLSTGFINPLLLYIFIYLVTQAQIQHSVVVAIKHGPIKITNLPESIHIINQRGNWGGNTELWLFFRTKQEQRRPAKTGTALNPASWLPCWSPGVSPNLQHTDIWHVSWRDIKTYLEEHVVTVFSHFFAVAVVCCIQLSSV